MRVRTSDWRVLGFGLAIATASAGAVAPETAQAAAKKPAHAASTADKASSVKDDSGKAAVHIGGGSKTPEHVEKLSVRGGRVIGNGVYYHLASRGSASKSGKMRFASRGDVGDDDGYGGSLQCVPFARAASGIELKGNAAEWWYAAAGVYDRGERPELGSVLNFRSTSRMRLGHVAVVTGVVNSREIEVDQANWAGAGAYKGGVARGVHVIDVSSANDWSAVQVALGNGEYGSTYPTYGFIYDRPDTGTMVASGHSAPAEDAEPTEVAEAPAVHVVHVLHVSDRRNAHVALRPIAKRISFR
jgi:hypothetical protein